MAGADATEGPGAHESLIGAELLLLRGRGREAQAPLESAWSEAGNTGDEAGANAAAAHLATLALHRVQVGEVTRWAGHCGSNPASSGTEAAFAAALGQSIAGNTAGALADLKRQVATRPWEMGLYLARGVLRSWSDELAGAASDLACVLEQTQGLAEHLQLRTHGLALLSMAEYRLGRWDESVAHAESSASLSACVGRPWHAALAHSIVVLALVGRGEYPRAAEHVREARQTAGPSPAEFVGAAVARAHGVVCSGLGDHEAALAAYSQAEALCDPAEPAFFCDADAKASALLALGRLAEAQEAVGILEDRAVASSRRSALAQVARLRAALARATGEPGASLVQLRAGLDLLDGLVSPYEEARLRIDYGQCLLETGDRAEGLSQLEAARGVLVALGARPLLGVCGRAMEEATPARPPDPLGCLSEREHQVVALVMGGLGNQAIAERLNLSTKRVEACLTALYARLGIKARAELGDIAAHSGSFRASEGVARVSQGCGEG